MSKFALKKFQREDYARCAMQAGAILAHDTGGGKGIALFIWACLKVGINPTPGRGSALEPLAAVLFVVPGDLHDQVIKEGREKLRARVTIIDCQDTFLRLSRLNPVTGRRELPPGFYITSYTQLASNKVAEFPPFEPGNPDGMMNVLGLKPADIEAYFDNRAIHGQRYYERLSEGGHQINANSTAAEINASYEHARRTLGTADLGSCRDWLMQFVPATGRPDFRKLAPRQIEWIRDQMIEHKWFAYKTNIGQSHYVGSQKIKCVHSPSLADLCSETFAAVCVDEGVKMKGAVTLVGQGVRQMNPRYRLVLTATPIKNRLPDIFWLVWWVAGGHEEADARWPYPDSLDAQQEFAEEFLISERNLSAEENSETNRRFQKLTPQVCNVHRLWKLFAPVMLRRRKQDFGEDIVKKVRHIVRVPMGRRQADVYRYHIEACYKDSEGNKAIGPQLQALRIAAANPASSLLLPHPSETTDRLALPYCSQYNYIPKVASALNLIHQILQRGEQVVVFSAFQDSLDGLSARLNEAGVKHLVLDGRMTPKKRGVAAARFKLGPPKANDRAPHEFPSEYPVILAGIDSMASGHSWHRTNNIILMCYSWAYDSFEQAINRVHRLNSLWDVNVYPIICDGSIDRRLEAMIQEKGDAAELVLDGHLLGEHSSEVNLAELLDIARREFNTGSAPAPGAHEDAPSERFIDERELEKDWPRLRADLATAARVWSRPSCTTPIVKEAIPMLNRHPSNQPSNPRFNLNFSEKPKADRVPAWRRRCRSEQAILPIPVEISELPLWRQKMI